MVEKLKLVDENFKDSREIPGPPEELSYSAKVVWLESAEEFWKKGWLDKASLAIFHNYCVLIGEARECEMAMAVDGKVIGGKRHPMYSMMLEAISGSRQLYETLSKFKKVSEEKEEKDEENNWKKDKGLLA